MGKCDATESLFGQDFSFLADENPPQLGLDRSFSEIRPESLIK